MSLLPGLQLFWLFILALPIACVSWTVTHEEVFREPREYCQHMCTTAHSAWTRKFFYLFTCEYCFSHYVTALALIMTGYKLLIDDWRGYLLAGFALVWIANIYMSLFGILRVYMKYENIEAKIEDKTLTALNEKPNTP
jgi:hypothetical protein